MAGTKQGSVSGLRPGSYIVIEGVACKVNKIETSRPGKHGHAKCRIDASSLIDGNKKVIVLPGHDKIDVPIIDKKSAQVLSVSGDNANVMDEESYETFDIKISDEFKGKISEGITIVYWDILGDKVLKEIKSG
ncbi:MAG: translation initiation factor IF-5A [Nanoarchaeota archaeon]|nr:translation initiation factor IF-5A [Nanoarchaeota archaeon]|tara:strand:- start:72 stop:470 length:399 start_codon:yes stop_codon:yes gene_type:complete